MELKSLSFYFFSSVLIASALRVITARNPVHSALSLVLSFFSMASIWMLLKAEFLSIILVLVYVGAVMVLFIFVVMMIDINTTSVPEKFWGYFPLGVVVGSVMVVEISTVILHGFHSSDTNIPNISSKIGNTRELGKLIYTEYIYAFEVAAVILLVAIVAAVALTLRRHKDTTTKSSFPSKTVKVKSTDRIRIVSMKSETKVTALSTTPAKVE
jgi:NADH-quinone oxidoreductase subunit J